MGPGLSLLHSPRTPDFLLSQSQPQDDWPRISARDFNSLGLLALGSRACSLCQAAAQNISRTWDEDRVQFRCSGAGAASGEGILGVSSEDRGGNQNERKYRGARKGQQRRELPAAEEIDLPLK